MSAAIRVLLVEDQRILREGLRTILDLEPDIKVVGEAENGLRAVELTASLRPDVVLMDLKMPLMDGVEATRRIAGAGSGARVVILTTYDHDNLVFKALQAGALGYLLKDDPADEMIRAIHLAYRGESLLQPAVAAKLVTAIQEGAIGRLLTGSGVAGAARQPAHDAYADPPIGEAAEQLPETDSLQDVLTERELQVLALTAQGASNQRIAQQLHLAEGTVKNHISVIMSKLGAANRTEAVAIARRQGLIS